MKSVAVISDIHDNLANLHKVIKYIKDKEIEYLICTGDCQTMDVWEALDKLDITSYGVLGNGDGHILNEDKIKKYFKNMTVFPLVGNFEIEGKKFIISHYISILKEIIDKGQNKFDIGLYGHTHKPWEEYYKNTKLLNSGNVANIYYVPTFAVINLENLNPQLIFINQL